MFVLELAGLQAVVLPDDHYSRLFPNGFHVPAFCWWRSPLLVRSTEYARRASRRR